MQSVLAIEKTVTIHVPTSLRIPSSPAIVGIATLTMNPSSETRNATSPIAVVRRKVRTILHTNINS